MKKLIIIFISIVWGAAQLVAQAPESHEKTFYQSPDGKLYWNRYLPFYLSISPSASEKGVQLESSNAKDYVNPAYFDNEGLNNISTPYAVNPVTQKKVTPQIEIKFDVYADGSAPVSSSLFGNTKLYTKSGTNFYGKGLTVKLNATDKLSGLKKTFYSIDGDNFKPYNSPLEIEKEGERSIFYYSVDNVGNVEEVKVKKFAMDIKSPITIAEISEATSKEIFSKATRIKLSASDDISGVNKTLYRINDEKEMRYSGGYISKNQLPDGEHTIYYYSYDNVSNKEEERFIKFYLDKLPPIVASDALGDKYDIGNKTYFSGRSKFKITAVDNKSGVDHIYYQLNNGDFVEYTTPFELTNQTGVNTIKFYAVDKMDNSTIVLSNGKPTYPNATSNVYLDVKGPSINIDFKGPKFKKRDTTYISPETNIALSASDSESGVQKITYSLNGTSDETKYVDALNVPTKGRQTINFYGYDNVNNKTESKSYFFVDNMGPKISAQYSVAPFETVNGLNVYPDYMEIYTFATDKHTGNESIFYSVNGGKPEEYRGKITGFVAGKTNEVTIVATDKVGNKTSETFSFIIEK